MPWPSSPTRRAGLRSPPYPPGAGRGGRRPAVAGPALAARVYGQPAGRLQLYGITGTKGKTTTAYLLDAALRAAGSTSA